MEHAKQDAIAMVAIPCMGPQPRNLCGGGDAGWMAGCLVREKNAAWTANCSTVDRGGVMLGSS